MLGFYPTINCPTMLTFDNTPNQQLARGWSKPATLWPNDGEPPQDR
jgi:hypothetical protein